MSIEHFLSEGKGYLKKNDFAKAIMSFERALQIDPSHEGVLKELALTYKNANQPENAILIYRRLLELNPSSV